VPEISQADLNALVAIKDLQAAMLGNAQAREMLLRAVKVVKPDATNEIDVAERATAPIKEDIKATKTELETFRKEWLAEKAEREKAEQTRQFENQWAAQENALRRDGYMDGAITKIKELAAQKGIVDLADAAAVYDKTAPAPEPISSRFNALSLIDGSAVKDTGDEYMKALFAGRGEAAGAQREQINLAIKEARSGRAA
jgi:hypothetical protein